MKIREMMTLAAFAAASAAFGAAIPTITSVTATQPNGVGKVTVNYVLEGDDAIVLAEAFANGDALDASRFSALSGAVNCKVTKGANSFTWKPSRDLPGEKLADFKVKLTAWPLSNPPDWMVADLTTGDVRYYASTNDFPDGGLANDAYRTTRLVMRHIPAANVTWTMGTSVGEMGQNDNRGKAHEVTLTKDYWLGIYEVTQKQYDYFSGVARHAVWRSAADADMRPTENISFKQLRCPKNGNCRWPQQMHDVEEGSPIDNLRKVTGIAFDLPTEAQWEFACRAGTWTSLNSGKWLETNDVNVASANMDEVGWYSLNSKISGTAQTHPVGLKRPNAFGLYDMHGNVLELCLDRYNADRFFASNPQIDPIGDNNTTDGNCAARGGSSGFAAQKAASGNRDNYCGWSWPSADGTSGQDRGFRLWAPID